MVDPVLVTKKLLLITKLLDALHANEIVYCHWKGNEHLDASMEGNSDLDVLFDIRQKEKLEPILASFGFKLFEAIKEKRYKDIVDYLGFDVESGKVIHLHTHYRLTLGEMFLMGYQLDLEEGVLKGRIFNSEFGIYCIDPAYEMVLLFVREALKLRNRDALLVHFKKKIQSDKNVLRKYEWLKARTNDSEIENILKTIFADPSEIYPIVTGEFNRTQLQKLAPLVKRAWSKHRFYHPITATLLRWYREAMVVIPRKMARLLAMPILSKRINPRGGLVVAIVGADGSGKSTVTANLSKTFSGKLDVYKIYFGRGDGKISLERRFLRSLKPKSRSGKKAKIDKEESQGITDPGFLKSMYKSIEAILVASEKRKNVNRMLQSKQKGMLVICDRFPQNQVMGYNDGPLLSHLLRSGNPLFKMAANWESKIYTQAEGNPPDILFKLIADAEVVEKRKPGETPMEKLEAKIEGIRKLKMGGQCQVITVDASRPLEEVLTLVKMETWNRM